MSRVSSVSWGRQQGFTLTGLVAIMIIAGMGILLFMKVVPAVVEFRAAKSAIIKAVDSEPTPEAVIKAFDKAAQVDQIETIAGKDLKVVKDGGRLKASFKYEKRIELIANASLLLDFQAAAVSK